LRYVPDFRLSELNAYLEVKGRMFQDDVKKMDAFIQTGCVLYIVDDIRNICLKEYGGAVCLVKEKE